MSNEEQNGFFANTMLPAVSRQYRPTYNQWKKVVEETELEPYCHHSKVELINFQTSKIHLKGGGRLAFDCLSEAQYLHVVNGGYYEDAPPIDETARV
ncbi:MAG: hypothetical protein IPO16_15020 [Saprospiraceae bacterium]|nr:hypothetical protein [Saprospiraceae bacterium]